MNKIQAVLTVLEKNGMSVNVPVGERIRIGRKRAESSCELQLDSSIVSRLHGEIYREGTHYYYRDLESTNGVYINGERYGVKTGNMICELRDGDRISFEIRRGNQRHPESVDCHFTVTVKAEKPELPAAAPPLRQPQNGSEDLVVNIRERSVVQHFKKYTLLKDIRLSVSNGEMVLILGGSGAGKTTFINAVMGYEKADGEILYNNIDVYKEYDSMKYEIGFVPQQDLLRNSDTVYDTLANAAEMKLSRGISAEGREQRIQEVLNRFGLTREKDSLVSKLSGGQKKRLSIAVEFIGNPSLFFLDEPDSGIDDVMGRGLMETLREIADLGVIVMVITHSPERALDLFDKVLVLAKSTEDNCGHLAYYGGVQQAFEYFGVKSFREIVKKINRPDENGEGLSDYFIEKYRMLQGEEDL